MKGPFLQIVPYMKQYFPSGMGIVLLCCLGAGLLYALGRWDQFVNDRWESHKLTVNLALGAARKARAREDSMRSLQLVAETRANEAEQRAQQHASVIAEMEHDAQREAEVSATAEIADLLPKLQMRPIDRNLYGTDSAGVRFLEGLRLQALKVRILEPLRDYVTELNAETTELRTALYLASERADSASVRALHFEGLLRETIKLAECHIDPFDLIPCPSRGVMLVSGIALGVTATLVLGGD